MKALSILQRREIPVTVAGMLLSAGKVKVTTSTLQKDLLNHPDYPALLSISDVLEGYGVGNIAFVANMDKLDDMPVPFIAQVKSEYTLEDLFVLVRSVEGNKITYYDPELRKWKNTSRDQFLARWPSKVVFIADATEARGEQQYEKKRVEERRSNIIRYFSWLSLPVLVLLAGAWRFASGMPGGILSPVFLLLTLAGVVLGTLLLWYELDEYNPVLQKICSAGKKVNCGAVLSSKASRVAGVSWSVIGFTYFTGGLFVILFAGLSGIQTWLLLAWLSALASPYVLFSVYYQWKIAKQWCVLCLSVQGLLVLQLTIAVLSGWHVAARITSLFSPGVIIPVVFSYLIPFVAVNLLMPLYRIARENKQNRAEILRLKHNPQIFESLLNKQAAFPVSPNGLGISVGNPAARHKILKICNPYCLPCAESHIALEHLVRNNDAVQLQIVFVTSDNPNDPQRFPVRHILAIAEHNDTDVLANALDDWYSQGRKDYDSFARRYPVPEEWKDNEDKLKAMAEWIETTGATYTPTVFVNGRRLPPSYAISDLKYFFSV
jgi:uncharacterized membrane protein